MRARVVLLVVLASGISSAPAAAQSSLPQGTDDDSRFRRGLALYDAADYPGAIMSWETLRQSVGEARGWKLLYNLGRAYEAMGDPTRAIERYESFVRAATAHEALTTPEIGAHVQAAQDHVSSLEASYGAVSVAAAASGAVVMTRVGAGDARPAGYTLWVSPGEHDVEVGTGTSRAYHVKVQVKAGATVEVKTDDAVTPAPAQPPAAPMRPTAPTRPNAQESHFPTPWVVVGAALTLASAALPIAFGVQANSERQQAQGLGQAAPGYTAAANDYQNARSLYYYSYAVPAVLAVATAATVVVGLSAGGAASRTDVHASFNGTGGSLWFGGQF